jgi:hypothetical protein
LRYEVQAFFLRRERAEVREWRAMMQLLQR